MQFQHQRLGFNELFVHRTLFGKLFSAADSVSNEAQLDDGCKAGSCMATPLLAGELQIGKQVEALPQLTFFSFETFIKSKGGNHSANCMGIVVRMRKQHLEEEMARSQGVISLR